MTRPFAIVSPQNVSRASIFYIAVAAWYGPDRKDKTNACRSLEKLCRLVPLVRDKHLPELLQHEIMLFHWIWKKDYVLGYYNA